MMLDLLVEQSSDFFSSSVPSSLVAVPTFVAPTSPPSIRPMTLEDSVDSPPENPFQFIGILEPTYMPPAPIPDTTDTPSVQSLVINLPGDPNFVPGLATARETDSLASRASKLGGGLAIAAALAALWFVLD